MAITLFMGVPGFSQLLNWEKASSWLMYDTIGRERTFQKDSLSYYRSARMNDDTMKYYLSDVSPVPIEKTKGVVWMGYYRVSCQLLDTTRVLLISRYGGFFADLSTKVYYEIPVAERASWYEYFNQTFGSIARFGKTD